MPEPVKPKQFSKSPYSLNLSSGCTLGFGRCTPPFLERTYIGDHGTYVRTLCKKYMNIRWTTTKMPEPIKSKQFSKSPYSLNLWSGCTLGFGRCTPPFLKRTYARDHRTYVLQIVHEHMMDHIDVCYFLEYPLNNIWMYAAPFGPLHK
jgi:hypothetical protein